MARRLDAGERALGGSACAAAILLATLIGAPPAHAGSDPPSTYQHEMMHGDMAMMEPGPLGIPDSRNGSGTSWQPDTTPMHARHFESGPWMLMLHGSLFVAYDHQGSDRGDTGWTAPNWAMLMETRILGGGSLVLRQMLSLDPVTVGSKGYPLLLQTGESYKGEPIHDRQHAHDLFMEIAAAYTRQASSAIALQVYAAPAGEPALGPVAFPHRLSASSDPLAPLAHHWQDSTHISFGVFTAGVVTRSVKIEGSWFNGREPDEHRTDFDLRRPDSTSGRIAFNPSERWSLQASYGYIASPEELHPDVSLHRLTASAAYVRGIGASGCLAATAVFGRNDPDSGPATSSALAEANFDTGGRSTFFGRAEWIEKTGEDLVLPEGLAADVFRITSVSGGYVFRLARAGGVDLGAGAVAAVNFIDGDLEPFYGTRNPAGGMVFLRVHPAAHSQHASAAPPPESPDSHHHHAP